MNTHFAIATHILTFLQTQNGVPSSSELIASSVNTNPSFIRRLSQQLAKAGLTKSQMGVGGGLLLGRPASTITLLDVYKAVELDGVLPLHQAPNPLCPVGRNIGALLAAEIEKAEQAMMSQLAKTNIADMAKGIASAEAPRNGRKLD